MSRRQDKPTKSPVKKERADKPAPKPKETQEELRRRIQIAFRNAFGHEDK